MAVGVSRRLFSQRGLVYQTHWFICAQVDVVWTESSVVFEDAAPGALENVTLQRPYGWRGSASINFSPLNHDLHAWKGLTR